MSLKPFLLALVCAITHLAPAAELQIGFAEIDITPALVEDRPVSLAGYGHGRRATLLANVIDMVKSESKG